MIDSRWGGSLGVLWILVACGGESTNRREEPEPEPEAGASGSGGRDVGSGGTKPTGPGDTSGGSSSDPPPLITGGAASEGAGSSASTGGSGPSTTGGASALGGGAGTGGIEGEAGAPNAPAVCQEACEKVDALQCDGADRKPCTAECAGESLNDTCRDLLQAVFACVSDQFPASLRCSEAAGAQFVCGVCDADLSAFAEQCGAPLGCVC